MVRTLTLFMLALGSGAGCVDVIGEAGRADVGAVVTDCVVPAPDGVVALGAPVSLELPVGSLWIFGETELTAGGSVGSAAALARDVDDACAGRLELVRDADGAPAPFIPLTAKEQAENAARSDGRRLDLVARGGFVAAGQGTLYYDEILRGPGPFDAEWLGTGVCAVGAADAPCARAPGLVWSGAQPTWGAAGLLGDDGEAYLGACFHAAAFTDLCGVARVDPAAAGDAGAYSFFNAFNGWVNDPHGYTVAFDGPGAVTLAADPQLGGFTAVSANLWDSTLELRTAPAPEGPWSEAGTLVRAVPPDGWFISGGVEHAALRSADGRTLAVSYHTVSATGPSGLHLVTVRVGGE